MIFTIETNGYDLAKTLRSGQVFRFEQTGPGWFKVHADSRVCKVTQLFDVIRVEDDCSTNADDWFHYFAVDFDRVKLRQMMSTNRVLREAYEYSKGIALLRQEPFECLVSFIISQQKRIPQIQAAIEGLCNLCGSELHDGSHAFPKPEQILNADLSSLKLGYRMDYVYNAAEQVLSGKLDLEHLHHDYSLFQDTMQKLQNLYGVGAKVASCTALFSLGFSNAFPIDTHIQRVLALPEMHGFNPEDYGEYAGYVQQYLFTWALNNGY